MLGQDDLSTWGGQEDACSGPWEQRRESGKWWTMSEPMIGDLIRNLSSSARLELLGQGWGRGGCLTPTLEGLSLAPAPNLHSSLPEPMTESTAGLFLGHRGGQALPASAPKSK